MTPGLMNLNSKLIKDIGVFITNNVDYFVEDKSYLKLCAATDRIKEIIDGLNNKELHIRPHDSAFEFYEYLSQSFVLIDAISIIAETITTEECDCKSLLETKTSTKMITADDITGNGNDYKFCKYIRSLCSEHPVNTNQHKDYSEKEEWCPFVSWSDKENEVIATVYSLGNTRIIRLSITELSQYISHYYNQLAWIIHCLEKYLERRKTSFRKKKLRDPNHFDNYLKYLAYLKKQNRLRMDSNSDCLNLAERIISTDVSTDNKTVYDHYVQCIKKALTFEHNRIQLATTEEYNCRGTKETNTTLLNEILYPPIIESDCKTIMDIWGKMEKLIQDESAYYSSDSPSQAEINSAKSFQKIEVDFLRRKVMNESNYFSRYVEISESTSNSELYVLIHIALFMEAMEKEPEKYEGLK